MYDYYLRRMHLKRGELVKELNHAIREKARSGGAFREAKARIETVQRIQKALDNSATLSQRQEFEQLLASYPTLQELEQRLDAARSSHQEASDQSQKAAGAIKKNDKEIKKRRAEFQDIVERVGERAGDWQGIQVILKFKRKLNRVDVYWGGWGYPLGRGHGHAVFVDGVLKYKRDPCHL